MSEYISHSSCSVNFRNDYVKKKKKKKKEKKKKKRMNQGV